MMTDRDRLIELYEKATEEYAKTNKALFRKTFICDYLLANGAIVPPCKVGDIVYFLERHPERFGGTKINTAEVLRIKTNISHKGMTFWLVITYRDINGNDTCDEVLYGRTAFRTKEEAEENLRERNE